MSKEKKTRAKRFSDDEEKVLLSLCDRFFDIINKNSNKDVDTTAKSQAWKKIHTGFHNYCKAMAISVSSFSEFTNLF